MSRLTRRAVLDLGDEVPWIVVPHGARIDVGLDWSRVLLGELIRSSTWELPEGATTDGNDLTNFATWVWLTNVPSGWRGILRNDVETYGGPIISRRMLVTTL